MAYARIKAQLDASSPVLAASRARQLTAAADGAPGLVEDRYALELERLRDINQHLLSEIEHLKEREAETQQLADRDALTGLYNRRRMEELLEAAITEARTRGEYVGLLFIDMNGFKGINDEYGHAAGDKVLTTMATRIAARVRTGDVVCRYGGDEFVVILPNVPDAGAVSRVADAIRGRVTLPYWIAESDQHLTAAIGESLYPFDGDSAASLLQRADEAMYRLKMRLSRPLVSLGSTPQPRPARRRGDKTRLRAGGAD
jgi:diguanylate cyclase (GGDEF)-like protein